MGDFDPALAAYERAAGLAGPARMDAIANRGSLFVEHGRKEEARASHRGGGGSLSEFAGHPVRSNGAADI